MIALNATIRSNIVVVVVVDGDGDGDGDNDIASLYLLAMSSALASDGNARRKMNRRSIARNGSMYTCFVQICNKFVVYFVKIIMHDTDLSESIDERLWQAFSTTYVLR